MVRLQEEDFVSQEIIRHCKTGGKKDWRVLRLRKSGGYKPSKTGSDFIRRRMEDFVRLLVMKHLKTEGYNAQ